MNFIVFCAISLVSAWVFSQVFKTLLNFCTTRNFKLKMLFSDGDFPSTHTTTSVAAVIVVCYEHIPILLSNNVNEEMKTLASGIIVVVALWAAFIIRDALGIRLRVQELSKTMYKLLTGSHEVEETPITDNLQDFWSGLAKGMNLKAGHMPHEVIGGLILGIIFGVGASSLRASNHLIFIIDIAVFVLYTIISFIVVGRKRKK